MKLEKIYAIMERDIKVSEIRVSLSKHKFLLPTTL